MIRFMVFLSLYHHMLNVIQKLFYHPSIFSVVLAFIKKIYEKVQAGNREEALRKARRLGWI